MPRGNLGLGIPAAGDVAGAVTAASLELNSTGVQIRDGASSSRQVPRQLSRHVSMPGAFLGASPLLSPATMCPQQIVGLNRLNNVGGIDPGGLQADTFRGQAAQECYAIFGDY
jgi:hypothetical protein